MRRAVRHAGFREGGRGGREAEGHARRRGHTGADIGCWRSLDSGTTWQPFSEGLPDAAIFDLKLHGPRRLLRASTHGRSVFERTLDNAPKAGVELYVRDTQLDQGRFPTSNGLPDPTQPGEVVRHWRGPDIKVDTPNSAGDYQFPLTGTIDFLKRLSFQAFAARCCDCTAYWSRSVREKPYLVAIASAATPCGVK